MSWMGALASVVGGLISSDAAGGAADAQKGAADAATQLQRDMFEKQNQQQEPYRQAGYTSLDEILRGFGLPTTGAGAQPGNNLRKFGNGVPEDSLQQIAKEMGIDPATLMASLGGAKVLGDTKDGYRVKTYDSNDVQAALDKLAPAGTEGANGVGGGVQKGYFSHQFDKNDLTNGLAPNYDFMLSQGQGAVRNAGNLQSGLISGNTLKGINDYTQNYAGNAYQQAYNNYTANQSNIFNRLSTVAGFGSAANAQSSGLAGTLAPSIAGTIQAGGQAAASGIVGQANALSGGANNALGWYQLNKFLTPNSSGGGAANMAE